MLVAGCASTRPLKPGVAKIQSTASGAQERDDVLGIGGGTAAGLRPGRSPFQLSQNRHQSVFVIWRESAHIWREVLMAFKSLQGQLLLDNGRLHGSFFHRSVLLICQHDKDGAFGLVLNRITGSQVGDGLTSNLPESLKAQALFLGGPVQPQALSYLHSDEFLPDASVMPNLNLDHSLENLVDLGESFSSTVRIKVFAGYAGWSPGQLDDEMKRDTWPTHPASLDLVFHEKPDELWAQILKLKGWKYRLISDQPSDLSAN